MTDFIRVVLVEDNREYADAVRLAIEVETDIELTGHYGTAEFALKELGKQPANEHPHVILLDLRLPGADGLEAIPQLLQVTPLSRIVVLTQSQQEHDVVTAITQGASGYLLKSATVDQLIGSIRTVTSGGAPLDAEIARFILQAFQDQNTKVMTTGPLTDREVEVLTLLAQGLVKKEIAVQLKVSYTTIDTHISRIYGKLNVNNGPAAVNEAHRRNILGS